MSVLIEAVSLVIPILTLDHAWPRGAAAFVADVMSTPGSTARHVCRDDTLVSVSFLHPEHARAVIAELREHARGGGS